MNLGLSGKEFENHVRHTINSMTQEEMERAIAAMCRTLSAGESENPFYDE